MATMAFMMVTEFPLARDDLTGGGAGLSVASFDAPFDSPAGLYWLVAAVAGIVSWLVWNLSLLLGPGHDRCATAR